MAIYKPPTPRYRVALVAGVVGLAIGLGAGLLIPSGGSDPVEVLRVVKQDLAGAASVLEVLQVEYRESVHDGDVVSEAEYRGSLDALARSRARFAEVRSTVEAINPDVATRAERAYADLEDLMREHADADDVSDAASELADLLTGVIGG